MVFIYKTRPKIIFNREKALKREKKPEKRDNRYFIYIVIVRATAIRFSFFIYNQYTQTSSTI